MSHCKSVKIYQTSLEFTQMSHFSWECFRFFYRFNAICAVCSFDFWNFKCWQFYNKSLFSWKLKMASPISFSFGEFVGFDCSVMKFCRSKIFGFEHWHAWLTGFHRSIMIWYFLGKIYSTVFITFYHALKSTVDSIAFEKGKEIMTLTTFSQKSFQLTFI